MTGGPVGAWLPPASARRRGRAGRIVYWTLFGIVGATLIGLVIAALTGMRYYTNLSTSMEPALASGSRITVERGAGDIRRGDIVLIASSPPGGRIPGGTYAKRLIGLPGDHVACCDAAGDVTVDGKVLDESQYLYPSDEPSAQRFSVTLGPDQVWVMGDHRLVSYDSRAWGPVPLQDITGRAIQVSNGFAGTDVTTPRTFVTDGLAPPDTRSPLPLVLLGLAVADFVLLLAIGIIGAIIRGTRRGRERSAAAAASAGTMPS